MIRKRILSSLSVLFCGMMLSTVAWAAEARLAAVVGTVEVRSSAASDWTPASAGSSIPAGGEIRTSSDSTAQLTFTAGQRSAIDVRPDSYAQIESVDPARVRIQSGKIFSLIKDVKPGSSFVIVTPTAIAAARGTGGEHAIDDLIVRDGTFVVETPSGQTREVSEGFGVEFRDEGFGEQFEAPESSEWTGFAEEASANLDKDVRVTGDTQDKPSGGDGGGPGGPGDPPGPSRETGPESKEDSASALRDDGRMNMPEPASMDKETDRIEPDDFAVGTERMIDSAAVEPMKDAAGGFEGVEDIMDTAGHRTDVPIGDDRIITEMSGATGAIVDRMGQTRETYQEIKTDDNLADRLKDPLPQPSHSP